jgi:hypothetical protein
MSPGSANVSRREQKYIGKNLEKTARKTAVATENLIRGVRSAIAVLVRGAMFAFLTKLLFVVRSRLKSRASLEAENLVLRQQVIVLSRKSRSRERIRNIDRLVLVWLYRFFPSILNAIVIVKPETVIAGTGTASEPIGVGSLAGAADVRGLTVRSGT